jgi:hypothetical protein
MLFYLLANETPVKTITVMAVNKIIFSIYSFKVILSNINVEWHYERKRLYFLFILQEKIILK